MGISRRMIQRLTRSRGIQLNRRPAYLQRRVRPGDIVAARVGDLPRAEGGLPPVEMDLSILYEDSEVLALDKPAGLLVHPISPRHTRTLAHGVAFHLQSRGISGPVRPVHRLDRDTSGAILFALSGYAHQLLDRQLRSGTLTREYFAVVAGHLDVDEGVVDAPIGRSPRSPTLRAVVPDGGPARTRFEVVERVRDATILRLTMDTGRTHQIRVHAAHIGHPVLGDRDYGGPTADIDRTALHSRLVSFDQPRTGEHLSVAAPIPEDIRRLIASRGGQTDWD